MAGRAGEGEGGVRGADGDRLSTVDDPGDPERRGPLDDTIPAPADSGVLGAIGALPFAPGDRYRLGAELGRGGMGRVVEAFDLQLGRTVALKEVLPRGGPTTARRFAREVQLTARLEHPSIVPLYDAGVTPDGRPFYVMRRVSGRPLDELVARARGLGERLTLLPAMLAAIDAVAHAHRRGVIHRDLKPANILVGELGETVVIDWGLAKVIGEDDEHHSPTAADSLQTQMGSVFGTPGFMAPEQARGEELGTDGDVYALGATLYQLLAGTPPHPGTSATEVIEKTHRHDIVPLATVAPGAPAELTAIVHKALAFEAGARYPDAGALGEDVRRFLAGQLVAAHRYTRRQKLRRFARRHRGALAVGALAVVAVAVLAWVSIARIVTERDAADAARTDAVAGKRAAETARDALAERHDALLVTQARSLLDANPTEAAATLKAIATGSPRIAEAKAIAQAAAVRGTAWWVTGTSELTLLAELDHAGERMLQSARDGVLRVWDLDRRRIAAEHTFASGSRGWWIANGRVLVLPSEGAPLVWDPMRDTTQPLASEPLDLAVASERGERVLVSGEGGQARLLDGVTLAIRDVAPGMRAHELAIAPDGRWFAVGDHETVVVFDASGRELTRRAVKHVRLVAGEDTVAALGDNLVVEGVIGPLPTWTVVPLAVGPLERVFDLVYRGRELDMYVANRGLVAWNGTNVFQRLQVDRLSFRMMVAGSAVVVPTSDGKLHYATDFSRGVLNLPRVVPNARFATRPSSNRVVAVGDGVIVGFELGAVSPQQLPVPVGTTALWADDRTLLLQRNVDEWWWHDLATGAKTPITTDLVGMTQVADYDPTTGRVLMRTLLGATEKLLLLRRGQPTPEVLVEGRPVWGRLLPDDGVVFSVGDGRLFAATAGVPARVIAKLDGVVRSAVTYGRDRYAAYSTGGELVRGNLTTGTVERTRIPGGGTGFVAADPVSGRVVLGEGRRLLLWDGGDTVELARFDLELAALHPVAGGMLVSLADHAAHVIEPRIGATPRYLLPAGRRPPQVSHDGTLVAGVGAGGQITVVEMPTCARWTLPILHTATDVFALSPTTRRLLQGSDFALALWTLPSAGELGAFLDELTNAVIDADGVLR